MKKYILLSLIILFSIKTQNISANQNIFAVDNIEVNSELTTNDNISREKYLNIGFKKAFKNLVLNILRKEDHKKILTTDLKKIKSLIENYRIIEEKSLDKKYSIKLSVVFSEKKIKKFLYERNIPYSQTTNLEILLYPIMVLDSEIQVFSENKFFNEWNSTKEFENINFILPLENIEDINFIKENMDILEEIDLSRLVSNYEVRNSSILIFRYNENKLKVFFKTSLNDTKKINKVDFTVDNLENEEVRSNLISNLKFYIYELWKQEKLVDISTPASLTFFIKLKSPQTLQTVTSKLKSINFIEDYSIEELSTSLAKVKIRYLGKIKNVQDSFYENGFEFQIKDEEWVLSLPG